MKQAPWVAHLRRASPLRGGPGGREFGQRARLRKSSLPRPGSKRSEVSCKRLGALPTAEVYRFNCAEILRSLSQQHETFLKDGEDVRRSDRLPKVRPHWGGRDPVIANWRLATQRHIPSLLFGRSEVVGFGVRQDGRSLHSDYTRTHPAGFVQIAIGCTRATRHSTGGY